MKIDAKDYREYLDKEMTIMGILSAVSVAAPAGVLNTVLGEQTGLRGLLWLTGRHFIVLGSVLSVLAALYFYKQRSLLAWYYGQISLRGAIEEDPTASAEVRELIRGADSWESWWPYSWGFTVVCAALSAYVFAFFFCLVPPYWPFVLKHQHNGKIIALCLIVVVAVIVAALQRYVLTHNDYKFSEHPWSDFTNALKQFSGPSLPHDRVYARLRCSRISGVGVVAIRDIPTGTYIFEPDDEELVSMKVQEVHEAIKKETIEGKLTNEAGKEIRKLYEDFCVLRGGVYECPVSFNKLTPSWFLNHSETPNVAADLSLRFYAIHEIKAGEELTADYRTYTENEASKSSDPR